MHSRFGLDPTAHWRGARRRRRLGIFEFHIEQGPVLESLGLPLGVVDAIAGQSRWKWSFEGRPTMPAPRRCTSAGRAGGRGGMDRRRGARSARDRRSLVATVGRIEAVAGSRQCDRRARPQRVSMSATPRMRCVAHAGSTALAMRAADRRAARPSSFVGAASGSTGGRDGCAISRRCSARRASAWISRFIECQRRGPRCHDHCSPNAGGDAVSAQPRRHQPSSG